MAVQKVSRLELCIFMHENDVDFTDKPSQEVAVFQDILSKLKLSELNLQQLPLNQLKSSIKGFVRKIVGQYKAENRHIVRLIENIKPTDYLAKEFKLPDSLFSSKRAATDKPAASVAKKKTFSEKSTRGQYLEAQQLREKHEVGAINLAASLNLKKEG